MRPDRTTNRRSALRVGAAGALLLLVGCTSSDDPGGDGATSLPTTSAPRSTALETTSTPTSAAPPTTAPDPDDPTAAILEAHAGFWDTWLAANDPPDPDHPGLRRYYTGPAYDRAVAAIEKNRAAGYRIRLPEESVRHHEATVVAVRDGHALVHDCAIDDGQIVSSESGMTVNDEVLTVLWEAEVVLTDDGWKIADNRQLSQWEGISRCDGFYQ